MATSRAVRIPRPGPAPPTVGLPAELKGSDARTDSTHARRANSGGSQRAIRLATLYVVTLAVLYTAFLLYDRTAPGGTAPAATNGVLLFTAMFALFAVGGAAYTLNPAPQAVEVAGDHVILVGRWGRRHRLPRLELLSVSVVRRYPAGWLSKTPVELVELWGEDVPTRSYLVDAELFAGAIASPRHR